MIAADTARRDDHRAGRKLELADDASPGPLAALDNRGLQHLAGDTGHGAAGLDEAAYAMAEFQLDQPARLVLAHRSDERLKHARTGAPGEMKTRHSIAVAV